VSNTEKLQNESSVLKTNDNSTTDLLIAIWNEVLRCNNINTKSNIKYGNPKKSNIETLELRRLRCDLILTYRTVFGLKDVVASDFFTLVNSGYTVHEESRTSL